LSELERAKRYTDLIADCQAQVRELMPWEVEEFLAGSPDALLVDVREPYEYQAMHIEGALSVPRGILESACDYGYEETVPALAAGRERDIVVICRSGYRSVLAAYTMHLMGFRSTCSLKTGLRGWNDYELPLVDSAGRPVDMEAADEYFTSRVRPDQLPPKAG
jgi:rhodanese-related sulfurtransferase